MSMVLFLTFTYGLGWQVVHERHILTIMYISVLEWVCTRRAGQWCERQRLFPNVELSEALRLEVAQLKKKFDALALEYGDL